METTEGQPKKLFKLGSNIPVHSSYNGKTALKERKSPRPVPTTGISQQLAERKTIKP
jgi:hypothetical protein